MVSQVTITEPNHPLFGRTFAVAHTPASYCGEAWLILQLPTGEHRRVPCSATDLSKKTAERPAHRAPMLPLSARTLLPLAHHVRRLLGAKEESADDTPSEASGGRLGETPTQASAGPTPFVAESGAHSAPTTGPVSGRTHSAHASRERDCTQGGTS